MNMVSNTANTNYITASSIDQLSYITMHTFQMLISNLRTGSLHMEDDMQIYLQSDCAIFNNAYALSGRYFIRYLFPRRCHWAISLLGFQPVIQKKQRLI